MEKKKDILANIIFILVFLVIYFILTKDGHLFASTTDFQTQHYLIPEYFRNLFYDTHELFPDFAFNLGGGQNIYYFSYYGLLNPIILFSYFFPFIKMIDYMIFINCLIVLTSTLLFYFYLKKNDYCFKTRFVVSILFLCSGPLIFHAHRHVMFMNYMPFLILGLYGIDRYLEKNKLGLLVISIILMIFTSYYYSVAGLVALFIFSIYKYIKIKNNISIKEFIKHSFKMAIPYLIGVMISSIIILPTLYTLLNGRDSTTKVVDFFNLITPSLSLLYKPYSMGLTIISLIALIYLIFSKNKANRFMAITCLIISIFPLFNYILNGTLYINSKSLIPFIPLVLILVSEFLNNYFIKKIDIKQLSFISYLLISSFIICLNTNFEDKLMKKEDINNKEYNTVLELVNEITNQDKDIYRINNRTLKANGINLVTNVREYKSTLYSSTYNSTYSNLYFDILNNPLSHRNRLMTPSSNNIISQMLLGEKYVLTKDELGLDLKLVKEKNDIKVYQNDNVLPIGYASNNIVSEKEYESLSYPNNVICLLNSIVVSDKGQSYSNLIEKIKLDYEIIETNNLKLDKNQNNISIKALKDASIKLKINNNMDNKILFIRFNNLINPNYDTSIIINNVQNKLTNVNWKYHNKNNTFDYVLYDTNLLNITFTKGDYELGDFEFYVLDYENIKNIKEDIDEFKIDYDSTKGDFIVGDISVKEDSYFVLTIPYDKGFKILIDNKEAKYEKVNTSFIGFPISKGEHHIVIEYEAPYKKVSLFISLLGIIALCLLKIFKK